MVKTTVRLLLVAVFCASTTGCKGTALRNLLTRSDYKTLNELEAEPGTEKTARSALVSQETDLTEETSEDAAAKRRGLFNLSGLFKRKSDEDLGSDPFVETADEATGRVTVSTEKEPAADAVESPSERVASVSREAAEELVRNVSANEDIPAEQLFRDLARQENTSQPERPARSGDIDSEPQEDPNATSFADFLAEKSQEIGEAATETAAPLVKPAAEAERKVEDRVAATVSEFDELLTDAQPAEEESEDFLSGLEDLIADVQLQATETTIRPDATESSNPFTENDSPELTAPHTADPSAVDANRFDEFVARTTASQTAEPSATTEVARSEDAFRAPPADPSAVPFEDARRSHGFDVATADDGDPWSAFRTAQQGSADRNTTSGSESDESFAWAPEPGPETSTAESAGALTGQEFVQADRTEVTQTPVDLTPRLPEEPVVPVLAASPMSQQPPQPVFDDALVIPQAPDAAAPFDTAVSMAETDGFDDPVAIADAVAAQQSDAQPAETTAGFPISGRTLFLLIGMAAVAFLLFMPERQNRTDS